MSFLMLKLNISEKNVILILYTQHKMKTTSKLKLYNYSYKICYKIMKYTKKKCCQILRLKSYKSNFPVCSIYHLKKKNKYLIFILRIST